VINYGVRSDGIGEIMDQIAMGETKYWGRWIFDLSFYVLVIIILLNIIFGTYWFPSMF